MTVDMPTEAKYSADQLRGMLAKGHALRNDAGEPSYPIGDTEDLNNAIRAVGRGGASHNKIRAYIIRRAKALGASDKIPNNWTTSGTQTQESTLITESTPLAEAASGAPKSRRFRARLIAGDIQGSSGYYSSAMLKRDGPKVFAEGLPIFIDHPGATEAMDRPERSIRDLAGRLATTAKYESDGLYADIEVYPHVAPVIEAMAGDIGMSIRAAGTAEPSAREGIRGPMITSLTDARSVDFVTAAGAGGKVVALLESARTELREGRNVGAWLESRLHLAFTQLTDDMYGRGGLTREERTALSSAIGDGLAAFTSRVEADTPQLYDRDIWDEPPEPGDAQVSEKLPVGAPPPGNHPLNEGKQMSGTNGAPNGGATDKIPADIAEAQNRVKALETQLAEAREQLERRSDHAVRAEEALREAAQLREENHRFRALESARSTVAAALAESGLPETAWPRVTAAVVGHEGSAIPLDEKGAVHGDKLKTAIEAAIKDMQGFVARIAEDGGAGRPRGLGSSTSPDDLSEADLTAGLKDVFTDIGLPDTVADLAAKGR